MISLLITYIVGTVLFLMTSLVGVLIKGRKLSFRGFFRLILLALLWPGFVIWAIIQEYDEDLDGSK